MDKFAQNIKFPVVKIKSKIIKIEKKNSSKSQIHLKNKPNHILLKHYAIIITPLNYYYLKYYIGTRHSSVRKVKHAKTKQSFMLFSKFIKFDLLTNLLPTTKEKIPLKTLPKLRA